MNTKVFFTSSISRNHFFTCCFFVISLISCNIINPAEPIPSYLTINSVDFYISDIEQGTSNNKIEDVWVYIDGQLQGVYGLPASFPVLETGQHKISIRPGIYFNGIKSQRFPYPFYSIFDTTVTLVAGSETKIHPRSTYTAGLNFTNENFDSNGGIIFDSTSNSLAAINVSTIQSEVLEGNGCGKVILDSAHFKMEIATGNLILPVIGSQRIFVEVNYKSSHELVIGINAIIPLQANPVKIPIVVLKSTNEWNKIYLEITNPVHANSDASSFQIYFFSNLSDLNSTGTVYLDNFKVIND